MGDVDPERPDCMVVVRDSFEELVLLTTTPTALLTTTPTRQVQESPGMAVLLCVHQGPQPDAMSKVGSVLAALKVPHHISMDFLLCNFGVFPCENCEEFGDFTM